jgi:hypothetical protein
MHKTLSLATQDIDQSRVPLQTGSSLEMDVTRSQKHWIQTALRSPGTEIDIDRWWILMHVQAHGV